LTEPLVRDGGVLRTATWDEALDRAARGIRDTVARHGPNTFGLFSCSKATNEVNYTAMKFARVAAGFARARTADASTSFGIFSCSKATNEMNFLAQKFARQVMGTNNIDSCNRT
jgi:formate dehydrogenase major subunit